MFHKNNTVLSIIENSTVTIFIIDYVLRFLTADFKYKKASIGSFLRYPFSFMAIVDLLSILPAITILNSGLKTLRLLRMFRAMRVFRAFKLFRYSTSIKMIVDVLKKSKVSLIAVSVFAIAYILVSALVIFNVEPKSFDNFYEAIYWATVSLTTVGYGDLFPISITGRTVAMISSFFGIAIVALPAGILTAGFMKELESK